MSEVNNNDPVFEDEITSETSDEEVENISEHDTGSETTEESENISDVSGNDESENVSENEEVPEEDITNETISETVVNDYHPDLSDIKNINVVFSFIFLGCFLAFAFMKGFDK